MNSQTIRKNSLDIALLFIERMVSLACGFLVNVAIYRSIGPSAGAIYFNILAIVTIFVAVSKIGLDNIIVQRMVGAKSEGLCLYFKFLAIRLAAAIVGILVMIAFHHKIFVKIENSDLVIVSGLVILQTLDIGLIWARSRGDFRFLAITVSLVTLLGASIKIAILLRSLPYHFLLCVLALEQGLLLLIFGLRGTLQGSLEGTPLGCRLNIRASDAGWAALSSVCIILFSVYDASFLPFVMPLPEVGRYLAGKNFIDVASSLVGIISIVLAPHLTRSFQARSPGFEDLLEAGLRIATWTGIVFACFVLIATSGFLELILGRSYRSSFAVILILAAGVPVLAQGAIYDFTAALTGQIWIIVAKSALAIVAKTVLLFLASDIDAVWAAVSTMLSIYIASIASLLLIPRRYAKSYILALDPRQIGPALDSILRAHDRAQ